MVFCKEIVKALWAIHPQRFWMVWIPVTTASLIYVMSTLRRGATQICEKTTRAPRNAILTRRQIWNPRAIVVLTLSAIFLASYIAMILVWEDFAYYDDDLFMLYALKGSNYPLPIWRDNGRFFPFGMQEFNLIRHFTNSPIGYHLIPIFQLLILFCILLTLDTELSITARAGLAILALLTPSIFVIFGGLVYEERNVVFLLMCLVLSLKQFERTKAATWAVAAVASAQVMLYFKETAFLLLFAFAAGRLILRCRNGQHTRWDYERLWDPESRLDLSLVGLAVLFLFSYFAVMGIHGNTNYITNFHRRSMPEIVLDYLKIDVLIWLFVAVALRRMYLILWRGLEPWPLWDGLACGGAAWLAAYLYLGFFNSYYLAPADLIALLYVGRFVLLPWKNTYSWNKATALILACIVVLQDVSLSAFAAFERKNDIHAKVEIASVIKRKYRCVNGNVPTLFFPFAKPYSIMEFVVYLNYRGVLIDGAALIDRAISKNDRCIEYRSIRCHPATEPASGDLVVVLPDDQASLADALVYRKRNQLLFSYEPRPLIAHWLYSFVDSFPLPGAYSGARPDRWMDASVSVWN